MPDNACSDTLTPIVRTPSIVARVVRIGVLLEYLEKSVSHSSSRLGRSRNVCGDALAEPDGVVALVLPEEREAGTVGGVARVARVEVVARYAKPL